MSRRLYGVSAPAICFWSRRLCQLSRRLRIFFCFCLGVGYEGEEKKKISGAETSFDFFFYNSHFFFNYYSELLLVFEDSCVSARGLLCVGGLRCVCRRAKVCECRRAKVCEGACLCWCWRPTLCQAPSMCERPSKRPRGIREALRV
jgi:hypothetical protein